MEHGGEKRTIEIQNFSVFLCVNCGSLTLDESSSNRLYNAYIQTFQGRLLEQSQSGWDALHST